MIIHRSLTFEKSGKCLSSSQPISRSSYIFSMVFLSIFLTKAQKIRTLMNSNTAEMSQIGLQHEIYYSAISRTCILRSLFSTLTIWYSKNVIKMVLNSKEIANTGLSLYLSQSDLSLSFFDAFLNTKYMTTYNPSCLSMSSATPIYCLNIDFGSILKNQ